MANNNNAAAEAVLPDLAQPAMEADNVAKLPAPRARKPAPRLQLAERDVGMAESANEDEECEPPPSPPADDNVLIEEVIHAPPLRPAQPVPLNAALPPPIPPPAQLVQKTIPEIRAERKAQQKIDKAARQKVRAEHMEEMRAKHGPAGVPNVAPRAVQVRQAPQPPPGHPNMIPSILAFPVGAKDVLGFTLDKEHLSQRVVELYDLPDASLDDVKSSELIEMLKVGDWSNALWCGMDYYGSTQFKTAQAMETNLNALINYVDSNPKVQCFVCMFSVVSLTAR